MRTIVGTLGSAGGHGTMAGARLFSPYRSTSALDDDFQNIVARLREVINEPSTTPESLLTAPRES